MYDVEFGEVRLGHMGSDWARCGSIGSGGVISHTVRVKAQVGLGQRLGLGL